MSGNAEKSPGLSAADIDAVIESWPVDSKTPKPKPLNLVHRLMWDDELEEQGPFKWLIEGILPAGVTAALYGDPGIGKSFLAVDWALCVGTGESWKGHRVDRGDVVYVCAEGWQGMKERVLSWKAYRDLAGSAGVAFLGRAVRLLVPKDISAFADSIEAQMENPPKLIVLDTLARNAVGLEENDARDMGQVVASCDVLRERLGCTVLLVHHSTKSKEHGPSLRGHSSLKGAMDTVALVTEKDDKIRLYCEKQKDAPKFAVKWFSMLPVGRSVVLIKADPPGGAKKQRDKNEPPQDDEYPTPTLGL